MDGTSTSKSRLFGGLILVLIVVTLSALIPSSWLHTPVKKERPFTKIDLSGITAPESKITDVDGDGVISWSEAVSISLSDSTSTLELIKNNPIDQKAIAELNDPNNLTGSFSKNLFLATAQLRELGATDELTKQRTIESLMEQEALKINQSAYALKDLRVETSETKASIQAYGNAVAPLVKDVITSQTIESDLTSLVNYIQFERDSDLSPIAKNKARVDALLQKLLLVRVPPSAQSYHLLAVNRVAFYRDTLDAFMRTKTDPVRSTLMFNTYQDTILLLARIPMRFSEYFTSHNIVFKSNEAGYIFTGGL